MGRKITREVVEGYLHCKTKAHLKLAGQQGSMSDYEALLVARRQEVRQQAIAEILAKHPEAEVARGIPLTVAALQSGPPFVLNATLEDDLLSLGFDGLKRVDGASKLGDFHYVPVLYHGNKVGRQQKILVAVFGLTLARMQGMRPSAGLVARGPDAKLVKVRLDSKLYRQAEQVIGELQLIQAGGEPPRLTLNAHCQFCEFRQRCRTKAVEADDISLLGGVGEKELKRYHRKGIFTLTRLSYTFRPRRWGKRVKRSGHPRYSALQALAIREKKVHVFGTPDLPKKSVQVFLDAEGNEDASFAYLLGVVIVEGESQKSYSFWADDPNQVVKVFDSFLDLLDDIEDFVLFHYGGYEKALLRRMRRVVKRKRLVDRALAKAVNVLSAIHTERVLPRILKRPEGSRPPPRLYLDRGGCLGPPESLVWRARWEQTREPIWKEKLLTYNAEDCAALRKVAEFVQAVGEFARWRGEGGGVPRHPAQQSPGRTRSRPRPAAASGAASSSPSRI